MTVFSGKSFSSLRFRLTTFSGVLALLLLLVTWTVVTLGRHSYATTHSQAILDTVAKELLEEMEPSESAEDDFPEMVEEINEATFQTSERLVVIHLKGDRVVARSHVGAPNWPIDSSREWIAVVLPYHEDQCNTYNTSLHPCCSTLSAPCTAHQLLLLLCQQAARHVLETPLSLS